MVQWKKLLLSGGIIFKDRYSRPAHRDFPKYLHVFAQELWFTNNIKRPVLKFHAYFLVGQETSRSLRLPSLPAVSKLWSLQMRGLNPSWREKVGRSIATTSICPGRETNMEMGRNLSSQPAASALLFSPLQCCGGILSVTKTFLYQVPLYKMCNHFEQFTFLIIYCNTFVFGIICAFRVSCASCGDHIALNVLERICIDS